MKRKFIALLCAASMVAVMLGGCGNLDKESSRESSVQEESSESKEEVPADSSETERTLLRIWSMGS